MAAPCFSDYQYGYTNRVPIGVGSWGMSDSVLGVAPVPGMDINGVIYSYTANKERPDDFEVTISHENLITGGTIFSQTDDWSGKSGGTINKALIVPYSPIQAWGDGSMTTTGTGSISDGVILYSYRLDPCFDPQSDPNCPGYVQPMPELPVIEIYNAMDDDAVVNATAETDSELYERENEQKEGDDDAEEKERLEAALTAADNALTIGDGMTQAAMLQAMNISVGLSSYYSAKIPGGEYRETIVLKQKKLPDNPNAARLGLRTQALHEKMVNAQWGK